MMKEKPPHGDACNGCGKCCQMELCPLGRVTFGKWEGPCPALTRVIVNIGGGEAFACGMMIAPRTYAPVRAFALGEDALREAARMLIGAGVGCDGLDDGEQPNEEFSRKMRNVTRSEQRAILKAIKTWGYRPEEFFDVETEYRSRYWW